MKYKGLTIVIFALVTFGFVSGYLTYHRKLSEMLGREIVQAKINDLEKEPEVMIPPVEEPVETETETPTEVPADPNTSEPEVLKVPDLFEMEKEKAKELLLGMELIPDIHEEFSEEYDEGIVFWQTPYAGVVTEKGKKITFSVSRGSRTATPPAAEGEEIVVPDLIGLLEAEAVEKLQDEGFEVGFERKPNTVYGAGYVYSQNYLIGAKVPKGTKVTIRVSTGSN